MSQGPRGWLRALASALLTALVVAVIVLVSLVLFFRFGPVDEVQVKIDAFWPRPPAPPTPRPAPTATPTTAAPRPSVAPRLPAPHYEPRDAARSAADAYADLMHAAQRGDAPTVAKYVPREQLERKRSAEETLRELAPPVPIESIQVVRAKTVGERAALLLNARAPLVKHKAGKPAAIQVVVRMMREGGYWKLAGQTWLNDAALGKHESDALAWAAAKPAATR